VRPLPAFSEVFDLRLVPVPDSAGRQGVAAARQDIDRNEVTQAEEIDRLERENAAIDWQPGRNPVFYTRCCKGLQVYGSCGLEMGCEKEEGMKSMVHESCGVRD
jgi:hypothetical protein